MEKIEKELLFVPGRVCLIGGISDLVAPYLSINKNLAPGSAIAMTIDKGIYSYAEKTDKFIYSFNDSYFECYMTEEDLERNANSRSFHSYMCGTLLYMVRKYKDKVHGLHLEIENMDLPIQKGLSSSAAICVTVAKQMDRLYDLNLTNDDIVKIAYEGEHLAGSKCGLLDQTTIANDGLVHINFLENCKTKIQKVESLNDYNILLVDLNAYKNTRNIMDFFNSAMPFPTTASEKAVFNFFVNINPIIVDDALKALEEGDLEKLGTACSKFQEAMDYLGNYCDDLKAPVLHEVITDRYLLENTYGMKGVGSGGDGSAMLLCKSENTREEAKVYLKKKYNMNSIKV